MRETRTHLVKLAIAFLLMVAPAALAQRASTRIGDVSRVQGLGPNKISGYGLVVGLNGTGDAAKLVDTQRKLMQSLNYFASGVMSTDELKDAKNVATVWVEATIPEHGVREGETIDLTVSALGAKSLESGQLMPVPLVYIGVPEIGVIAFAGGAIEVVDPDRPTTGVVYGGARIEQSFLPNYLVTGDQLLEQGINNSWIDLQKHYITIVLQDSHTDWSLAAEVAEEINRYNVQDFSSLVGDGSQAIQRSSQTALALDAKNILVEVPHYYLSNPVPYLRDINQLNLLTGTGEARVIINARLKTIVITGQARLSPTVISHAGLTLNVVPDIPGGRALAGPVDQQVFVPLDSEAARTANMADLLEALNRLKVPFEDRLAIISTLEDSGNLHAKVYREP